MVIDSLKYLYYNNTLFLIFGKIFWNHILNLVCLKNIGLSLLINTFIFFS